MAAPVLVPEPQFCDADGKPYAGGSIATYVRGTTTPKSTWVDPDEAALNTNPIILDAAGRCQMWGSGEYRLILRDAAGNEVWDAPSTTLVSDAMAPVILAPTIADAQVLLGIDGSVASEAAARAAADSAEQSARIAADNTLQSHIDAEVTRAEAAEANLQSQVDAITGSSGGPVLQTVQSGTGATSTAGTGSVTFPTPYTSTPAVCVQMIAGAFEAVWLSVVPSTTGFSVMSCTIGGGSVAGCPAGFCWIAAGT